MTCTNKPTVHLKRVVWFQWSHSEMNIVPQYPILGDCGWCGAAGLKRTRVEVTLGHSFVIWCVTLFIFNNCDKIAIMQNVKLPLLLAVLNTMLSSIKYTYIFGPRYYHPYIEIFCNRNSVCIKQQFPFLLFSRLQ